MDSLIFQVNAGVGAVVAIKDVLNRITKHGHTHLFELLYSTQANIGNTGKSHNECTILLWC